MNQQTLIRLAIALVLSGSSMLACQKATPPVDPIVHRQEIEQWQAARVTGLKKPDSWLSLVGLHWLEEGESKIGSNRDNAVVLPAGKAPGVVGSLKIENGTAQINVTPGVAITADGQPIEGSRSLKADVDEGGPTILKVGSLLINIVKRGDRIGVRVKDTESQNFAEFKGLEYFPVNPKWRIEARFEPYQPAKVIPITNVLGMTADEVSPGALVFDVDGKTYRVDPILEKGETDLFVMIADETTNRETYGAGRYLYVSPPDASGKVVVDFNKAYNPPCAFTNYATCPLPPRQNHLPLRIDAGEKKYTGTLH